MPFSKNDFDAIARAVGDEVEKRNEPLLTQVSKLLTSVDRLLKKYAPVKEDVDLLSKKLDRLIEMQVKHGLITSEELDLLNRDE